MPENTFLDILEKSVDRYSNKIFAIIHEKPNFQLTYKELGTKVNDQRKNFASLKSPVAIYLPSGIEWAIYFLAITCNGLTAIVVDGKMEPQFILNQLKTSQSKVIITTKRLSEELSDLWQNDCPEFYCVDDIKQQTLDKDIILPIANPNSLIIVYTSGSTGHPKGVVLTQEALCNCIYENGNKNTDPRFTNCMLALAPYSHVTGLLGSLFIPMYLGTKLVFIESLKPTTISSALIQHEVQLLIAPPVFYDMIHRKIYQRILEMTSVQRYALKLFQAIVSFLSCFSRDWGYRIGRIFFKRLHTKIGLSLAILNSAGARLHISVAKDLISFGYYVNNMYGLSETSGGICFNKNIIKFPKSVGNLNSNVQVKIVDPNEQGVGEIYVKTNQLFKGYFQEGRITNELTPDGWFKTGDLGYLDSSNYLYIAGRSKEIIVNAEGKKIYPDDVESFFMNIPWIHEICAFGVLSDDTEKIFIVCKILKNAAPSMDKVKLNQILADKNNEMPVYMRAQHILITDDELPRGKNGKISRMVLSKKYQNLI